MFSRPTRNSARLPDKRAREDLSLPSLIIRIHQSRSLKELSDEILVDFFRAPERLSVNHQDRHRLGAAQRDQFLFVLGVLPNILLDDLILAMQIGHAVEHGLGESALVIKIKFQCQGIY